ncbi:sterol-4-alpha-carboxylate 3-dehydrogenase [Hypoxylon sp. NC1633]|nr:sterol-4-alpha-carboxylate 3-dehydrogenase [Hypoxylon sp. NC1633]
MALPNDSRVSLGNVMVIGGTGFLGHHVVALLLERYHTEFISVVDLCVSQNRQPETDRVLYYEADITCEPQLLEIFASTLPTIVIHTASPLPQTDAQSSRAIYDKVNVHGTSCVIKACQRYGAKALVYTSSASVISDHISDLINADERWPRVRGQAQPEYYAESKAQAEDLVLAANRSEKSGLLTAIIRPSAMVGEGDPMLLPRLIQIYREGFAYVQVGNNDNLFDFTYAGNVAHAHLLAAEALLKPSEPDAKLSDRVDGQCFFITNDSPVYFWDFARAVWVAAGFPYDVRRVLVIPRIVALILAYLSELVFALIHKPATFNRQRVAFSTMTRYYNISKAKALLGYKPLVTLKESLARSVQWCLDQEKRCSEPKFREPA